MVESIILELENNYILFLNLLIAHIRITAISVIIATIIGLIIGIFISENKKIAEPIIAIVNIVYTIPSIALLGIFISITGIGDITAIIAITIYALMPIVRSTYTGIINIDDTIIEASEALGSTRKQILLKIKLPLAFPIIFSAIRNMVIMTVALAGIASFVGASGLGVAIYRGITTNNRAMLLIGSFLIAILALFLDWILGILMKILIKNRKRNKNKKKYFILFVILIGIIFYPTLSKLNKNKKQVIKIASKPTTEGYILAEITSEIIKNNSNFDVKITHGVGGGTSNLHPATVKGEFDMYPEYTGTSWQIVLKEKTQYSDNLFNELKNKYEKNYNLTWRGMFGFNDTYGIGLQKDIANKYNIKTYSDLAKYSNKLIFGAEYDFFEREDGFKALSKVYNLNFKKVVDMDNGLKYQALLSKKIDAMTVFTTDGELSDPRIVVLEDDLKFYPSYMAGIVVNIDSLKKYPELEKKLEKINNLIDETEMSRMNYEVEVNGKNPNNVARQFLKSKKII